MKVTTYGKIILIGEHSVVYGYPAIAMPFKDTKMEIEIAYADENYLDSAFYTGKIKEIPGKLQGFKYLIEEFNKINKISKNYNIKIESNIPFQRGMGSSASAAVGIAKALYEYSNLEYTVEDIISLANISEKHLHGNPSGVDIQTVAHEMPVWYVKGEEFEFFPIDLDAYLIIADTGIKGSTKEAVSDVKSLIKYDHTYSEYVNELGNLSREAREAIEMSDHYKLGAIMNDAQKNLSKLTVSNAELDEMIEVALQAGALGAKLTGGGRGGCMIALADSKNKSDTIKDELSKLGKEVWISFLGEKR